VLSDAGTVDLATRRAEAARDTPTATSGRAVAAAVTENNMEVTCAERSQTDARLGVAPYLSKRRARRVAVCRIRKMVNSRESSAPRGHISARKVSRLRGCLFAARKNLETHREDTVGPPEANARNRSETS